MSEELKNKILEQIKTGHVKMKPRFRFILETFLYIFGIILASLFALYLISFIIFTLRASGALAAPGFGLRGIGILFISLPWLLIVISIVLIIIMELLVKHFSVAYRRPMLYSLLFIIALSTFGALIVDKADLHQALFIRARQNRLPIAGPLYDTFDSFKPDNLHRGIILTVSTSSLELQTLRDTTSTVSFESLLEKYPELLEALQEGNPILIIGKKIGTDITAENIQVFDFGDNLMPIHRPMHPAEPLPAR